MRVAEPAVYCVLHVSNNGCILIWHKRVCLINRSGTSVKEQPLDVPMELRLLVVALPLRASSSN